MGDTMMRIIYRGIAFFIVTGLVLVLLLALAKVIG
jgi:hypothetical protein